MLWQASKELSYHSADFLDCLSNIAGNGQGLMQYGGRGYVCPAVNLLKKRNYFYTRKVN